MNGYERKTYYQRKTVAESYLEERFSHGKGKKENEATRTALEQALDRIGKVRSILDLPCGTGRFSDFFWKRGYRYTGADISMEMLQSLIESRKDRVAWLPVIRCDGEHLPFKNDVFDCVACVRFLNLVPERVRHNILKEMRRVSKRWLIVQSHHLKAMGPLMRLKVKVREKLGRDVTKYLLRKEIQSCGWSEKAVVRIKHHRQCIGIYEKSDSASAS